MSHLLIVDFNDQYHAIKRLWGNRSMNVKALLKLFPEADKLIAVAKAPNAEVVKRFDQMLKHYGFDTSYLLGSPAWQTCTALMIQRILEALNDDHFEVRIKKVIVVTGSRDACYIKQIVQSYRPHPDARYPNTYHECQIIGFSEVEWIPQLPVSVITPVPLSHVLGVEHVIDLEDFTDHAE